MCVYILFFSYMRHRVSINDRFMYVCIFSIGDIMSYMSIIPDRQNVSILLILLCCYSMVLIIATHLLKFKNPKYVLIYPNVGLDNSNLE